MSEKHHCGHHHEEHGTCGCGHHHREHGTCGCGHHHGEHGTCGCGHHHGAHESHHTYHEAGTCCEHCAGKLSGEKQNNTVWLRIGIGAAGFCLTFLPLPEMVKLAIGLAAYLLVGYDVLWGAVKNLTRGKLFDEHFLMSIATVGAFAIGEYPEGVAVMLFYQLGEAMQTLAVGKSRSSIASLMNIRPEYAVVLRDGKEETVSPWQVQLGEIVVVKPGERIPVDGVVCKGSASVDVAALTGESLPQTVSEGSWTVSGSINMDGVLHIVAEKTYADSTVAKILDLVEHAAEKKAKVENFITRFSRYYTPVVVLSALALALLPPLFTGGSFAPWIHRGLVFLVVSCPCALVISVPMSFFGGIGGAAKKGILVKGAGYLEQLSKVDTVLLDKTGTLTEGSFTVSEIYSPVLSESELLELAAIGESQSNHPIAKSILAYYGKQVNCEALNYVRELPGKGVCAEIGGQTYYLGNAALMESVSLPVREEGATVVHIAREGEYLGHLVISDSVKSNAAKAVKALRDCGIADVVMLTGDSRSVAEKVALEVGVSDSYSGLLPQDKVSVLEKYLAAGKKVAFVGDGINDAPVLAQADVGIAMGAMGSDAALASADIVLMDDNLEKLAAAVGISRKTMSVVWQNIALSLGVKGAILLLGALGIADMWLAVFGDVGVMLLALLNALRAMFSPEA